MPTLRKVCAAAGPILAELKSKRTVMATAGRAGAIPRVYRGMSPRTISSGVSSSRPVKSTRSFGCASSPHVTAQSNNHMTPHLNRMVLLPRIPLPPRHLRPQVSPTEDLSRLREMVHLGSRQLPIYFAVMRPSGEDLG